MPDVIADPETDPRATYVDASVELEPDVRLLPGTILEGRTVIGAGSTVGPDTRLVDTIVGEEAVIQNTVTREAEIGDRCTVGPYVSLRPGTRLAAGAHVGTFVETKNAEIGEDAKVPHLAYMGDVEVGARSNIGAGTDFRVRIETSSMHILTVAASIPSAAIRKTSGALMKAAIEAPPTLAKYSQNQGSARGSLTRSCTRGVGRLPSSGP